MTKIAGGIISMIGKSMMSKEEYSRFGDGEKNASR
jgi:hypothetical protein